MKTSLPTFLISLMLVISAACEGPRGLPGPEGPRGPRGPQGDPGTEAVVFDFENVDFLPPDFNVFINFPDFQALPSDVVLVYALWDIVQVNGEFFEVWRLLPQTTFPSDGTLVYNYNHTDVDVELFLDANFNIAESGLGSNELDDWIIRIVIVPGQFLNNGRAAAVDYSNYQAVKEAFNLPDLSLLDLSKNTKYVRPEVK